MFWLFPDLLTSLFQDAQRHLWSYVPIAHIVGPECFRDNRIESIDIKQISDKFPEMIDLCHGTTKDTVFLAKIW
eukprot:Awhi_evm1s15779